QHSCSRRLRPARHCWPRVCARAPRRAARFVGGCTNPRSVHWGRTGGPGAANIPYPAVLASDGALRTKEELREVFARAGVPAGNLVVVYCHSGNKAALVYVAARWAGINAELYEGSWVEWSRETELPAETGDR